MSNQMPPEDPYAPPSATPSYGSPNPTDSAYQPQGPEQVPYPEAQYAQAGQYAQPVAPNPQAYYYTPMPAPTDGFSVAALVLGVLGFNIFAIIFGIIGLNRTSSGQYSGRGMAIAGIVLGTISLIAILAVFIFFFSLMSASVGGY